MGEVHRMKKSFKFLPKAILATLLIGGLLLAMVASHGCDVNGSSPAGQDSAPITAHS